MVVSKKEIIHKNIYSTYIYVPLPLPELLLGGPPAQVRLEVAAGKMVGWRRGRGRRRGIYGPDGAGGILDHQQLVQGHVPVVVFAPHSLEDDLPKPQSQELAFSSYSFYRGSVTGFRREISLRRLKA